jgi:hypothetical protein
MPSPTLMKLEDHLSEGDTEEFRSCITYNFFLNGMELIGNFHRLK